MVSDKEHVFMKRVEWWAKSYIAGMCCEKNNWINHIEFAPENISEKEYNAFKDEFDNDNFIHKIQQHYENVANDKYNHTEKPFSWRSVVLHIRPDMAYFVTDDNKISKSVFVKEDESNWGGEFANKYFNDEEISDWFVYNP